MHTEIGLKASVIITKKESFIWMFLIVIRGRGGGGPFTKLLESHSSRTTWL